MKNFYVISAHLITPPSWDTEKVSRRTVDRFKLPDRIDLIAGVSKVDYKIWEQGGKNAAERALERIDARAADSPYGEDLRIGMEFATGILREELGRYHGE